VAALQLLLSFYQNCNFRIPGSHERAAAAVLLQFFLRISVLYHNAICEEIQELAVVKTIRERQDKDSTSPRVWCRKFTYFIVKISTVVNMGGGGRARIGEGNARVSPTLAICNEPHRFIYVSICLSASDLAIAA
jgi:hypothetical protein